MPTPAQSTLSGFYDGRVSVPAASVIVPTRGGATRLPVLLDALVAQVVEEPWEVVVVLDGDIDNSSAVLTSYAESLPLRVMTSAGGSGVGAALALGYDQAWGEILIRCDDDLTPTPDFVARHLAHHRRRPETAAPLGVIALTRDVFADTPYAAVYGRPANERLLAQAYARPADERWMHWAACNSVPKSAYAAAGGFDPTMNYREDSELGLRLSMSGVEMVIDPELEIEHRGPAPDAEARVARAFTSGASTRAFDERHPVGSEQPAEEQSGPWGCAVSLAASRIRSRQDAAELGRSIDRLLPRVPASAGGKLVAWGVEAAAVAGRRIGGTSWARNEPSSNDASNVTVVIPHYGDPEPTMTLVEQLLTQTHSVEVVVADDASPTPFPGREGIRVVRRTHNGGFGANVNSGASVATGSSLLVLNSDITIHPTFVAEMTSAAHRHPRAVLAPRVVDGSGAEAWTARKFPRVRHQAIAWLTPLARFRGTSLWHRAIGHDIRARSAEVEVDWVVGAAMWIPMSDFRAVGGFDERFFMNSEEIDLQQRLRLRGIRSVALRSPTVLHEGGGSSPSDMRRSWLVEGQLLYAGKWGSRRRLQTVLSAMTAANFAVNVIRRSAGRDVRPVAMARSEMSFIRGRRATLR